MENQQQEINQSQKSVEGYRGALVYRQEYGYKLITMMIDLHTPDERSRVAELSLTEEAEHLPAGLPLTAIDLYHFPATAGMEIELTIRDKARVQRAYYTVDAASVEEHSSFLWLDVVKARDSLGVRRCTPLPGESDGEIRSSAGGNDEPI